MGDQRLPLGGAKQRTVLAVLLLDAGHVVTAERLVDAVWGEHPPPSAAHTLEGYVSRLRATIEPHDSALVRSGNGYALDLRGAELDSRMLAQLVGDAAAANKRGDFREAADLARRALALWRGPALAGTPLRADAERLEELRLRAFEQRIDADLALGMHEEVGGELRRLLDDHPYRERLVGQLMLALYRSGRQADAIELYERTRRALRDDLGIHPGRDLQRLSAEIVRQDPGLDARPSAPVPRERTRRGRTPFAALAVAALALVAAGALALDRGGGTPSATDPVRIALVIPRAPRAGRVDTIVTPLVDGLRLAKGRYAIDAEIVVGDEFGGARVTTAIQRLRVGDFDLVLHSVASLAARLRNAVRALESTHFVLLDAYGGWQDELGGADNVTAVTFADDQAGYLAGYLSGLMERRRGPRRNDELTVSTIGGLRGVPPVEALVGGFARGARRALPGVTVIREYAQEFVDQARCEAIANRQIDAGSDIVFAAAGTCSLGALRAAGIRGVWGVGVDADHSALGAHILASTEKRFDQAIVLTIGAFVDGTLPRGGAEIVLGLRENAVGLAGISPEVPEAVRRRVARTAAALARGSAP